MASADDTSFERLALPHLDTVYRVARRLTRHDHEAEDLVQETYLKAYKAFETFEVREFGIKPWLLKILNNTFLNRVARDKRAPKAIDQHTLEQTPATDEHIAPPELDYENLDEEVKRALDLLPPEFRSVLLLWATMEMSYQEIADTLDLPIGTVMSRLHRARQRLAATLEEFAREHRIGPVKSRP
jgi:RNA polymerase sigma-70 factor (ECF subfamily)